MDYGLLESTIDHFHFNKLSTAIQMYIKSLNFASTFGLIDKSIEYKNEFAILSNDGKSILSTKDLDAIHFFKETGNIDLKKFNQTEFEKLIIAAGTRPNRLS